MRITPQPIRRILKAFCGTKGSLSRSVSQLPPKLSSRRPLEGTSRPLPPVKTFGMPNSGNNNQRSLSFIS